MLNRRSANALVRSLWRKPWFSPHKNAAKNGAQIEFWNKEMLGDDLTVFTATHRA